MVILKTHVTVDEFETFLALPENRDRNFELIAGQIVEKHPTTIMGSNISVRTMSRITGWAIDHDLGHVTGEAGGYCIIGNERYLPDGAFIRKEKGRLSLNFFHPIPPDLVVEVEFPLSVNGLRKMIFKLGNYVAAGIIVWIVYPEALQVHVFAPGQAGQIYMANDTLDGGSMLPGLSIPVREIFPADMLPQDAPESTKDNT